MPAIDYFFYSASPFTYLGHQTVVALAKRHGVALNFRPVDLFAIWEASGAVPPAQRPPVRQRMRLVELQRLALHRSLKLNRQPKFWPVDATLADCSIIALKAIGADPNAYMMDVFKAVWANDMNIADEDVLGNLLAAHGHEAQAILNDARKPETAAIRKHNAEAAIESDAPGVPAYVYKGECFWGQDRLELLDAMIGSGREPFKP